MKERKHSESGFALLTTYMLLSSLLALLGAYFLITNVELATTRFSKESITGFYAAEAGLNVRAQQVRALFTGYNRPAGTTPDIALDTCDGTNDGTGDFACQTTNINNRQVNTYITEDPANPYNQPVPAGDRYEGLDMQEYRYTIRSEAKNSLDKTEAILELRFKSRLVPMFQFVAFYNKDLEIAPGPTMNLSGPIHTNGDLYLNANNQLNISGQVTTAESLYRGRKNNNTCKSKPVTVRDPVNQLAILPSCPSRTLIPAADLTPWNDMVQVDVLPVTVPEPEVLDGKPGYEYWQNADLRLAINMDAADNFDFTNSPTAVEVRNTDNSINQEATDNLHTCNGDIENIEGGEAGTFYPVGVSNSFYNHRESATIRLLEVDLRNLFECIYNINTNALSGYILDGKALDDSTEGGLVMHLAVDGPNRDAMDNFYGARVRNGQELQANNGAAPRVRGLTIVTDQALYSAGHYNSVNKIPAAFLSDSFNVLSSNWNLDDSTSTLSKNNRPASDTTINAAILSGTDSTGGVEGVGGQGGSYNGGLENYPRFHENWSGDTLTYRGSFVSLNVAQKVNGSWGSQSYSPPARAWDYDTDFNDADNLPPLTPRFVYLRQELFVRDFEQ